MTHTDRKQRPVFRGVLQYFPDAIMEVAYCSYISNEQHNPGEPMYWNKDKSIGTGDEIVRHLMATETYDSDGVRHLARCAWRALELLQRQIDSEKNEKNIEHLS